MAEAEPYLAQYAPQYSSPKLKTSYHRTRRQGASSPSLRNPLLDAFDGAERRSQAAEERARARQARREQYETDHDVLRLGNGESPAPAYFVDPLPKNSRHAYAVEAERRRYDPIIAKYVEPQVEGRVSEYMEARDENKRSRALQRERKFNVVAHENKDGSALEKVDEIIFHPRKSVATQKQSGGVGMVLSPERFPPHREPVPRRERSDKLQSRRLTSYDIVTHTESPAVSRRPRSTSPTSRSLRGAPSSEPSVRSKSSLDGYMTPTRFAQSRAHQSGVEWNILHHRPPQNLPPLRERKTAARSSVNYNILG